MPNEVPAARAATMSTPGATTSGFTVAPRPGPRLENSAIWSWLSTAPTVSASSASPGDPMVARVGPLFPAAITKSAPVLAVRLCTASAIGSSPSVAAPPRLMLTTRACSVVAAHSIPAMMSES
nr:hypothetical protein [Fodinicola feengrottensis]